MVNVDIVLAILFYGLLLLLFFAKRDRFTVQGKIFIMYRTQWGIALMDRLARLFRPVIKVLGWLGIAVGFLGMGIILYTLLSSAVTLLLTPSAPPALAPVLPGIDIPGAPPLSFWHWVIVILLVAVIHEFSHGVVARAYNIKVKSSGFAFLGPILAAFVEPDEHELKRRPVATQLSVFAAGPFSNILTLFVVIFLFGLSIPSFQVFGVTLGIPHSLTARTALLDVQTFIQDRYEIQGLQIQQVEPGSAADEAGLQEGSVITRLDRFEAQENATAFMEFLVYHLEPNMALEVETLDRTYQVTTKPHPANQSRGQLGITFMPEIGPKKEYLAKVGEWRASFPMWFLLLLNWLLIISLGVGLFNLLPLGPVDGGRMFLAAALGIFAQESRARRVWGAVSLFVLLLLIINLLPWLTKLFLFLVQSFGLFLSLLL